MPRPAELTDQCRLSALGLLITSEMALPGTAVVPEGDLKSVLLRGSATTDSTDRALAETVLERHWENGALLMRVQRLPDDGYAVDAPEFGSFEVSSSGDTVIAHELVGPPERWQRLLFSQVLPIAATLRGHETLHASAVVIGGGAVAVTAPSGTGKSSLMMSLVDRGAELLADDVVALEIRGERLVAHAGPPFANLSREQYVMLSAPTREALGVPVAEDDKLTFAVGPLRARCSPLRALVEYRCSQRFTQLTISTIHAPSPLQLLAATFLPHVSSATRSTRQLEVCARLARSVPILSLDAPPSMSAADLATAVMRAVGSPGE